MRILAGVVWSIVFVGAVACGNYSSNRSALVPRATPRMTSGQLLASPASLSLGASSVLHITDPTIGDDPNAGIEIPGTQLFGSLRGGIGDQVSMGLLYEHALDSGATRLNADQPPVEGGGARGYGITFDASIPTGRRGLRVGVGLDLVVWSVPWAQFSACAEGVSCEDAVIELEGRDHVPTFAASLTPSYKIDPQVAVFGSLTVRNHPTIQQRIQNDSPVIDPEVDVGPLNLVVGAGAEIAVGMALASATLYYDVSQDPVSYGPGLGVALTIPLGPRRTSPLN